MKKFITKIIIVVSLPFLLIIYSLIVAFSQNLHKYEDIKQDKSFLIGEPFDDNYVKYYKINQDLINKSILAIGSSRVLQFKSEMFDSTFFNLGYLVINPCQTRKLIDYLNIKNKTIIIGLDQWAFNSNYEGTSDTVFTPPKIKSFIESACNPSRIYSEVTFKTYPKNVPQNAVLLFGAGANLAADGFVNDGSHYYGKTYHGLLSNNSQYVGEDYEFKNTIDRINHGNNRFEYGKTADKIAIRELEKLIIDNKNRNNRVVYFFPPFPPRIQILLKDKKYSYISDASEKISIIANQNKVRFYDFTHVESKDELFIDGYHGGPQIYYEILKKMEFHVKQVNFINYFETVNDSNYSNIRKIIFGNVVKIG